MMSLGWVWLSCVHWVSTAGFDRLLGLQPLGLDGLGGVACPTEKYFVEIVKDPRPPTHFPLIPEPKST